MISTIEGPFEDELVTSLLARTFHGIIGPTRTQFAEYIFGSATVVPVDFTCQMDAIAEKIGRKVGLGVEDLIFNHTMYPLGAFLMTSAQAEAAKKAMRVGKGAARHLPKWHRERAEDGLRHLKFCHACRAGDFKRTGTTWWRRVHQVPGVVCCHRHRCSLEISQFVPGRTWKHDYPPAELAVSVRQDLEPDKIDLAYVKDVHWVLGTNHSKIDPHELHLLYHERLRKMGLLNGWQLRRREFLDRFHAQRPRKEWEKRHLAFDPQDNSAWPAAVVKTKPNHESFQMHFLVMRFLGIPINGLSRMLDGIQEKVPKPEMTDHAWCRSVLRKKWNNPRWTNKALLLHLKIGVGRMYSIAEKDGLSIPRLPDRKSSQAFIKRRFQMRALVALGPEKIDPLRWSRLLRWMRRNDRAWLVDNLPTKKSFRVAVVNWNERERDFLARLPEIITRVLAERPFRRVSQSSLTMLLPFGSSMIDKVRTKMPLLHAEMKKVTESMAEFALRRVSVLRQNFPDMPPYELREKASVPRNCRDPKILKAVGYVLVGDKWSSGGDLSHPLYGLSPATGPDFR